LKFRAVALLVAVHASTRALDVGSGDSDNGASAKFRQQVMIDNRAIARDGACSFGGASFQPRSRDVLERLTRPSRIERDASELVSLGRARSRVSVLPAPEGASDYAPTDARPNVVVHGLAVADCA